MSLNLTTFRETVDIDRAYDSGANSDLIKPVEFNTLLEMMPALNHYWSVLNQHPRVQADSGLLLL